MASKLDLNLLKVLQVLFDELSVTAAASRLNLTQSAVSKHLAKLREMFSDKLFERTAQGLKATPRAIELAPQLGLIIRQVDQLIRPTEFEPILSNRQFRLHLIDMAYSFTIPFFMPNVITKAPNVSLKTKAWNSSSIDKLLDCEIDMAIACREWDYRAPLNMKNIPSELDSIELFREHSVCLVRENHPALSQQWGLDTFLKYRHIQVAVGGKESWILDDVLKTKNLCRDKAIDMPDFHSAMSLCEKSDLILCCTTRYAEKLATSFKLKVLSIPIDIEPGSYVLLWNKHFEHDLGHQWLRELIISNINKHTKL
jgi:DNA-binding transcriptional LysR family regulator